MTTRGNRHSILVVTVGSLIFSNKKKNGINIYPNHRYVQGKLKNIFLTSVRLIKIANLISLLFLKTERSQPLV